ncbi:MAG: hypothetical protein Q7R95_02385 [bacterium]|nr:hypothetical protein [bacterium]
MLRDSETGKEIKLPKIHGNTKVRNIITGKKDRTLAQWRQAGRDAADRLLKVFKP